jgi:hypothetical protein
MKWTNEIISEIKEHIKNGKGYHEISNLTGISWNSIRNKMGRLGEGINKNKPKIIKLCVECDNEIKNDGVKFCSQSCSATHNNKLRPKKESRLRYNIICLNCGKEGKCTGRVFCCTNCYIEYNKKKLFLKIENGDTSLYFRNYKLYLIEKYGNKCMECGWDKINSTSGKIPIELEHIDGDSSNNNLDNLKLLCPNCHSLTPTYKALNKGNGRHSRMVRYNEGKSF